MIFNRKNYIGFTPRHSRCVLFSGRYRRKDAGFTLIELLVVISIVGLLSSFAMVSLNQARSKARNALRKGDMAQLRTALSLYYDDHQRYPPCDTGWDRNDPSGYYGSTPDDGSACYNGILDTSLIDGTNPYMMALPKDPLNKKNAPISVDPIGGSDTLLYLYISNTPPTQYTVIYYLEGDTEPKVIRGF